MQKSPILLSAFLSFVPFLQAESVGPSFGAANTSERELISRQTKKEPIFSAIDDFLQPWEEWEEEHLNGDGIYVFGHYAAIAQKTSKVINPTDDDSAATGVFRMFGVWDAINSNQKVDKGTFTVAFDHRHAYTDIANDALAINIGYLGVNSTFYNDTQFSLIYLKYAQAFNNNHTGLVIGRYDPNDHQNVVGYENPWETFTNIAVMLDASVAFPDSSWGIAGGHWTTDQWYVLGGINDANGLATDNLEFFEGGAEFYKYVHTGWSPSKKERYSKNINLLAWHVDERDNAGIDGAKGIALSAAWTFDEQWMPFTRLGFSDGDAPIYNKSVTVGMQYKFKHNDSQAGIAFNWGSPPNDLRDQVTAEAFYKIQLANNLTLTPDIQYINGASFNPVDTTVWIYGIRSRLTF